MNIQIYARLCTNTIPHVFKSLSTCPHEKDSIVGNFYWRAFTIRTSPDLDSGITNSSKHVVLNLHRASIFYRAHYGIVRHIIKHAVTNSEATSYYTIDGWLFRLLLIRKHNAREKPLHFAGRNVFVVVRRTTVKHKAIYNHIPRCDFIFEHYKCFGARRTIMLRLSINRRTIFQNIA